MPDNIVLSPEVLQVIARIAQQQGAVSGVRGKDIITAPVYGPGGYFQVCDQYGYSIWGREGEKFLNNLGAFINNKQERLQWLIMDWRGVTSYGVTSSTDWCAVPPSFVSPAMQGCRINDCFDLNRYYRAQAPALTPNNFRELCFTQPVFNAQGQQITNEYDYQRFRMLESMRRSVLSGVVNDNFLVPAQEDGIDNWFANYAARHPELIGACEQMLPVTQPYVGTLADFQQVITTRVNAVNLLVQSITGGMGIPDANWYLLMNPIDRNCVINAQTCQQFCPGADISILSPEQLARWYEVYAQMVSGGQYGDGYVRTRHSQIISIMADYSVPRGTFFLLNKGWEGNPNTLRMVVYDYTDYTQYIQESRSLDSRLTRFPTPLLGGAALLLASIDICGNTELRWNWRLISNAPWSQTKFTGLPECDEETDSVFTTLEDLPAGDDCLNPLPN